MTDLDTFHEVDQDTLTKLALATAAGIAAVAGTKSAHRKSKEKKLLKKYTSIPTNERDKKYKNIDMFPDIALTGIDLKKYG